MTKLIEENLYDYIVEVDGDYYFLSKIITARILSSNASYNVANPYKFSKKRFILRNYIEFNNKKYILLFRPSNILEYPHLEEIIVEDYHNPLGYYSINGILYKNEKLCYYPPHKKESLYIIPDFVHSFNENSITYHKPLYLTTVMYKNHLIYRDSNDHRLYKIN